MALAAALRPDFEPYLFEQDRARRDSPQARCAQMIASSDAFIGILGSEYGSSHDGDGEPRSITEWEFDTASARDDLAIMMFLDARTRQGVSDPRQARFLRRIQGFGQGAWCKFFSDSAELVSLVRLSMVRWLAEYLVQSKQRLLAGGGRRLRLALALCVVMITMLCGAVVAHIRYALLDQSLVIGLCGIACGAILTLLLWVLMHE